MWVKDYFLQDPFAAIPVALLLFRTCMRSSRDKHFLVWAELGGHGCAKRHGINDCCQYLNMLDWCTGNIWTSIATVKCSVYILPSKPNRISNNIHTMKVFRAIWNAFTQYDIKSCQNMIVLWLDMQNKYSFLFLFLIIFSNGWQPGWVYGTNSHIAQ